MHINRNRITSPFYSFIQITSTNISCLKDKHFLIKVIYAVNKVSLVGYVNSGISNLISVSRAREIPYFLFKTGYQLLPQPNFIYGEMDIKNGYNEKV